MAKDESSIPANKDDGNPKSQKKDASSDGPVLRRSGRETSSSRKQATASPLNAQKSEKNEKQKSSSPSPVKNKKYEAEKQMEPSPLRRSSRGKQLVETPALLNVKRKKVKTANNSKESAGDVSEYKEKGRSGPDVGSRKRKRFNARSYKALFILQRLRIESDDDDDLEGEDNSPQPDTSGDKAVDTMLEDIDDGVGKCSGVDAECVAREPDCRHMISFTEEHKMSQNSTRVQVSPDKVQKEFLEEKRKDLDQQEHISCPLQTKLLDGKSNECGNVEKQIGGNCSASDKNTADNDDHMTRTSSLRINQDIENQQELDTRDKVTGVCKAANVLEKASNNDATTNVQNLGSIFNSSKFVEFWVPIQLSNVQLEQYCATLLSNAMALRSSSRNDTLGALKDVYISSRKCCNHPYLVDPRLQNLLMKNLEPTMLLDVGIKASGKLHFLDLILPEIKKSQLKVLILFQPTSGTLRGSPSASIGDILVDFVHQRFGEDSYEHMDGFGFVPSKKQAAVNKFNKDKRRFIFLLESRSCHQSIKFSSVDIIIVFDSDINPASDLRALQKIHIDSQSEQRMIFRLSSSCTLEEKILKLAEHGVAMDITSNLRSNYDVLLTWGASDLFKKLIELHNSSVYNMSSEEHFLKEVVDEFSHIISHKCKSKDRSKSIITRVQNCGIYGKNMPLHSEIKTHLPDGDQPRIFWRNLLEGKYPEWKFVSLETPRERKRPHYFGDRNQTTSPAVCGVKVRKKTTNAQLKPVNEGETGGVNEGASGVPVQNESQPVQNESQSLSGDKFWSTGTIDEMNHHNIMKLTVSELCNILKFSDDAKITVKRFLKYVLNNFHVGEGPTNTLQAFMISVCSIGSSLSNCKINKRVSIALAKKHLNFSCSEEEVHPVYLKLDLAMQAFLQHIDNQDICDALKDCAPSPQEPRISLSVSPKPQKVRPENHEPSNEETLQDNECDNQKEDVNKNDQKEIEEFNRKWDDKRVNLEKDYEVEKAIIRSLHRSLAVRSERLTKLKAEFGFKLELLKRTREIHLKDLKSKLPAAKGVHSREVATNDDVDVNILNVTEFDGANDLESTGSHTSEKQKVDGTVLSELVGTVPAQRHDDMEIDAAGKGDSVEVEENAEVPHVKSAEMGIPAGTIMPRTSHDVEDHNDSCGSSNLPSAASDHSAPSVPEIHSESLQHQQVSNSGIQDQVGAADPNPTAEVENDNLQPLEASLDQIIPQDPSLDYLEELSFPLSADLPIAENILDILNGNASQPKQNHLDPLQAELECLCIAKENYIKSHEENKQKLKSDCEKEIAEAIAQIRLKYNAKGQAAEAVFNSKKKEIETDLDRVARNKILAAAFRLKCQDLTRSGDSGKKQVSQGRLAQQLHRASGAPITRKSPAHSSESHQNIPPPPQSPLRIVNQPSALSSGPPNRPPPNTVLRPPSSTPLRPPPNINPTNMPATTPTRPPPTVKLSIHSITPAISRSPPGLNPITPSSTLNRSPLGTKTIDMSAANARINSETCGRSPQPLANSEIRSPASHMRMRPLISSEIHALAPHMRPLDSSEIRAPAPQVQSLTSSEIRSPAPHMRPLTSSEIRSPAPHLRPLSSSEIRTPAPHMRTLTSSDISARGICGPRPLLITSEIRAPAPHMRPFRSTASASPQKMLLSEQVTSSSPLTTTSNSQSPVLPPGLISSLPPLPPPPLVPSPVPPSSPPPPPSTSLLQPLPSLPPEPNPVPPPPPPSLPQSPKLPPPPPNSLATTSAPSIPSIPTSGGPNTPTHPPNADLLNLTDIVQESNALTSSGDDLICLSNDDFVVVD